MNQKSEPGTMSLDEELQALLEANIVVPQVVHIQFCTIDLAQVSYLEWTKHGQCHVILRNSFYNSDGDYWDRTPYLTGEHAQQFKELWTKWLRQHPLPIVLNLPTNNRAPGWSPLSGLFENKLK